MSNIPVSIESPVKYYDFTDQHGDVLATLKFVPTDLDIFERQQNVYRAFEDMWMELKETLDSKKEDELSLEIINKYAKSLQDKFDYLFNADTSGFFKIASPFTPMETGDPWALVKILRKWKARPGNIHNSIMPVQENTHFLLNECSVVPPIFSLC